MHKMHKVRNVIFDNSHLKLKIDGKVYIFDLRKISKRLSNASAAQRHKFEISPSGYGIYWLIIDEDLSIEGLLAAKYDKARKLVHA